MKTTRTDVYAAINSERDYQDAQWPQGGQPGFPNPLTIGEFVLLLEQYAAEARAEWTREKRPELRTLNIVRKLAGIAVNCMEQHGAPHRSPDAAWWVGKDPLTIRIVRLLEAYLDSHAHPAPANRAEINLAISEYKNGSRNYVVMGADPLEFTDEHLLHDALLLIG